MSKSTRKLIQTCKLICTILLVLVIGAQFLPYWYGEYTETDSKLLTEQQYLQNKKDYATQPTTAPEETEAEVTEPPVKPEDDQKTEENTENKTENENKAPALPAINVDEPLGFGNYNENVGVVQQKLIALGYNVGGLGADDMFGIKTERAVKRFQADNGLVVDGIVGPKTATAIDEAYAKLDPTDLPVVDVPTEEPTDTPVETPTEEPTEAPTEKPAIDLGIDFYEEDTTVTYPTLTTYSIAKYVWMFKVNRTNDIIFMPVLVLLFAVASIVTYCKNTYSVACSIWGVLAPAVGVYGFLTVDFFKTAAIAGVYELNLAINIIALLATLGTLILRIVVLIQTIKKERAERKAKSSFAD